MQRQTFSIDVQNYNGQCKAFPRVHNLIVYNFHKDFLIHENMIFMCLINAFERHFNDKGVHLWILEILSNYSDGNLTLELG